MPYKHITLDRTFFTGTMYSEAAYTKIVFLAILIECTDGVFVGTNEYLCRFTNLKPEAVERALEALQLPDPNSTSLHEEGRRIVPVPDTRNTFRIVNWAKYQPALSSEWKDKPGLTVVDPDTGEKVERLLPNGEKNPKYQKLYQRAYRAFVKERDASARALANDVAAIGVNSVNPETQNDSGAPNSPKANDPLAAGEPEDQHPATPVEPSEGGEERKLVNSVNKRKGNQTKENSNNPHSPPRKPRKPAGSTKALAKGDPKNADTFALFDEAYPRPSNGRNLQRADARITWDLLAEAGEDMMKIVEGARRYRTWVDELRKHEYVAMMTTWLNQRRWEESYYIHPESEEGKRIAARKEAEAAERKALHVASFKGDYEKYVESLAEEGIAGEGFLAEWQADAEAVLERRKRMGMAGAIKMAEKNLTDPEAMKESKLAFWKSKNEGSVPTFWEWDRDHNPSRFEG